MLKTYHQCIRAGFSVHTCWHIFKTYAQDILKKCAARHTSQDILKKCVARHTFNTYNQDICSSRHIKIFSRHTWKYVVNVCRASVDWDFYVVKLRPDAYVVTTFQLTYVVQICVAAMCWPTYFRGGQDIPSRHILYVVKSTYVVTACCTTYRHVGHDICICREGMSWPHKDVPMYINISIDLYQH